MRRFFTKRMIFTCFILALMAWGMGFYLSMEKTYPVETVEVVLGNIEEITRMAGYIDSESTEQVVANAHGIISAVSVKIGDRVSRGKILCEVRSPELRT